MATKAGRPGTWSPSATPIWTRAASTRDVWVHEGYAYVGQWGFGDWATGNSRFCATDDKRGVAVIDARDPASPEAGGDVAEPRRHVGRGRRRLHGALRRVRGPRHRCRRHPVLRRLALRGRRASAACSSGTSLTRRTPVPLGFSTRAAARGACTSSRCSTAPTSAGRSRTPPSRRPATRTGTRRAATATPTATATSG